VIIGYWILEIWVLGIVYWVLCIVYLILCIGYLVLSVGVVIGGLRVFVIWYFVVGIEWHDVGSWRAGI